MPYQFFTRRRTVYCLQIEILKSVLTSILKVARYLESMPARKISGAVDENLAFRSARLVAPLRARMSASQEQRALILAIFSIRLFATKRFDHVVAHRQALVNLHDGYRTYSLCTSYLFNTLTFSLQGPQVSLHLFLHLWPQPRSLEHGFSHTSKSTSSLQAMVKTCVQTVRCFLTFTMQGSQSW